MPKRIQRKRVKGWRLPTGAKCVTRGSRWGNPFRIGDVVDYHGQRITVTLENCIPLFMEYAELKLKENPRWLDPLRDQDLACFCSLDLPCHADPLLIFANPAPAAALNQRGR